VVFEAGRRTDSHFSDVHENIYRVGIGINGGRKWVKSAQNAY
jgi:hypothetical protein